MNERILELVKEAGMVKILDEHASEYGDGTFENTPYPELEKFAQLIVKEIIAIVEDQKNYNSAIYTTHDRDRAKGIVMELVKSITQQLG
jgi:hypothetical protein